MEFSHSKETLVLNKDGLPLTVFPISTISWQDAVKEVYSGRATVLESHSEIVRSEKQTFNIPSVIMHNNMQNRGLKMTISRRRIYLRDLFVCQYCFKEFQFPELTIDHVHAKSKGGMITWDNSVSSCFPCNNRKSNKAIVPKTKPHEPSFWELLNKSKKRPLTVVDENWNTYLQWPSELVTVHKHVFSL